MFEIELWKSQHLYIYIYIYLKINIRQSQHLVFYINVLSSIHILQIVVIQSQRGDLLTFPSSRSYAIRTSLFEQFYFNTKSTI